MSYWYLDRDNKPTEVDLPNPKEAEEKIMDVAKRIKLATQIDHFKCPNGKDGCFSCRQLEKIINGEGELIGTNGWQDIYVLPKHEPKSQPSQEASPTDIPY